MSKRVDYKRVQVKNVAWDSPGYKEEPVFHPPVPEKIELKLAYLNAVDRNLNAALMLEYFRFYYSYVSEEGIEWITLSIADIQSDLLNSLGQKVITSSINLLINLGFLEKRVIENKKIRQYRVDLLKLEEIEENYHNVL